MHCNYNMSSLNYCVHMLNTQNIIAYPTESMLGLGCDPDSQKAVERLLYLKKRKMEKGFILVAANYYQIKKYINENELSTIQKNKISCYWPGPFTLILPALPTVPFWLTGKFNTIAVRISEHISIVQLCNMFGKALISTSANISNMMPCFTQKELFKSFGSNISLLNGNIGLEKSPSRIINIINGKLIRDIKKTKI